MLNIQERNILEHEDCMLSLTQTWNIKHRGIYYTEHPGEEHPWARRLHAVPHPDMKYQTQGYILQYILYWTSRRGTSSPRHEISNTWVYIIYYAEHPGEEHPWARRLYAVPCIHTPQCCGAGEAEIILGPGAGAKN